MLTDARQDSGHSTLPYNLPLNRRDYTLSKAMPDFLRPFVAVELADRPTRGALCSPTTESGNKIPYSILFRLALLRERGADPLYSPKSKGGDAARAADLVSDLLGGASVPATTVGGRHGPRPKRFLQQQHRGRAAAGAAAAEAMQQRHPGRGAGRSGAAEGVAGFGGGGCCC